MKKLHSVVLVMIGATLGTVCGAGLAFAEEGRMMPPPMMGQPMMGSESGRQMSGPQGDMMRGQMGEHGGPRGQMGQQMGQMGQQMGQMNGGQMKNEMRGEMGQGGMRQNNMMMGGQRGSSNTETGQDREKQNTEREAQMKKQQLAQWTKQSAQYEKQVKKLRSDLERAKKKKDIALYPNILSQVENEIVAVESQWGEIKGFAAQEDMEGVMDAVSDLHDSFADAQRSVGFLSQLSSVSKMIKNADREITAFEKQVARLEKKKINVGAVRSLIAEARAKLEEIKALGSKSDVSPDDYFSLMQDLGDIRQQAVEEFNQLNGEPASSALGAAVFQAIEARRLGF